MLRVLIFDRFDQPIGELSEADVFGLSLVEEVNGEHSLTITTTRILEKGWRILTKDARGKWREHVVYGTDASHGSGDMPFGDYYCVWSLQADLMGTRVSRMPGVQTPVAASVALGYAIEGTARWQVGTVTNTNTGGGSMYDTDGWSAMSVLVANWGGEVDVTIEVLCDRVSARKVDYYAQQGESTPKRRYDFEADIKAIRRKIEDGPLYCRITPRGMGEETEDGYGRRITIESVNDGNDWLENSAMTDLAKLPDGSGGWEFPTIEVENADCKTPAELKAWALTVLDEYTVPQITYEIDVLQLAREGVDMHGVSLGDAIHAVDRKFRELRVSARVLRIETNLLDEDDVQITVGSISDNLAGLFGRLDSRISAVTETVMGMNGGTMSTAEYLSRLLDRLNTEINGTGGYTYIVEGHGIRTFDQAVADPTDGTEANSVVEIKGGTIRIANSKTAQGQWDWKTVFTSGHIAAGLVTAANINAGYIGSQSGNYWNLDSGELSMVAGKVTLGGKGIATTDAVISDVDVEYRLSDSPTEITGSGTGYSWSTVAPEWVDGAYMWQRTKTVNAAGTASYSDPTCIAGATGPAGSGINTAHVSVYQRAASKPSKPNTGQTYSFVNSSISGILGNGWNRTIPSGDDPLWVTSTNVTSMASTGAIQSWSDVVKLSQDGEDGTGVSGVVEQYYLSTSNTTQTGGSWSTDQPAWASGKYIWTRSAVTWTDGTTTHTDPVLAKAINGANEAVATLDGSLNQQGVFNRLTNNGQAQGIYMSQGEVYINASYVRSGVLSVASGQQTLFEADLDNGTIFMDADAIQIGARTLTQAVEDASTVYGTLESKTIQSITRAYATAPQFEPTDDTTLRLRVLDDTATYQSDTSRSLYVNGSAPSTNHGSVIFIPAGTTLTKGYMAVLEVDHFSTVQSYWRWRVTGCEAPVASESLATRQLFARDTSSVEINAGTVTFNANSFVVNSTYFQVTSTGVLTATSGTIGGLTLASDHIYNNSLDLTGTGLKFLYDGSVLGYLYPQYLVDDPDAAHPTLYGILGLQVPYAFQMLSKLPNASGDPELILEYEKIASFASGKGKMTVKCEAYLDHVPTITGALTTTVSVPHLGDSGRKTYDFTSGILTGVQDISGTNFKDIDVTVSGLKLRFMYGRLYDVVHV